MKRTLTPSEHPDRPSMDIPAHPDSVENIVVSADDAGDRLDRVLAKQIAGLSRSRLKTLILAGHVTIGTHDMRDPGHRVSAGERITVAVPAPEPARPEAQSIPLDILYEDAEIIVINKPAGLVVHPAAGHRAGTLVNALIAHCGDSLSGIGGERRPGIVHRLDKDTSGVMIVAKTDRAHQSLAAQFADHGRTGPLRRGYLAFVWGVPRSSRGTIDKPLGRHPQARDKMAVRADGRFAITHWVLLEKYPDQAGKPAASLVECTLETGRTHQIRVHLAAIGHPLIGDDVYGPGFRTKTAILGEARPAAVSLHRQALHACLLGVEHPASHHYMEFRASLPRDLSVLRDALVRDAQGATERKAKNDNNTKD
jgi:23S rRNA pseudouridine1911/1915/1917 synthase